ncbi:BRO family protein [Desulfotruncus alcoholivorax]|uniref:BRO family protein n=1 Tax=Desulfotruncus alcoholivorax TaxID=265477 RepID=UPI0004145BBB|nr:BRO family protein [Desulfotruncus alcoholivorax]
MINNNDLLPVLAQAGELAVVSVDGQPVVTANVLAKALGYAHERSVRILFNRNKDSFKEMERQCDYSHKGGINMTPPYDTGVVNLTTPGGEQQVRFFTKRGALKICMKSNQLKAIQVQEMLIDLYEAVESQRLVPIEALQEVQRRLDELAFEVKRLADVQQSKIVYLPKASSKARATDLEAA